MPHNNVMLHSFVPQHKPQKQHPSLHELAVNVERIALEIIRDLKAAIKKVIEDNIVYLELEIVLLELEEIEENLSEKGVDLATSLLLITDLIKVTIENQREKENELLPALEKSKEKAALVAIIAAYVAKKTSLQRHKMWPKPALIF